MNNDTLASVTHVLQYNLENPYDPGFTIHIVKNKPKMNTTKKSYIRNSMIRKMERQKFQDQISRFWNWQEKYYKINQECDLDTVGLKILQIKWNFMSYLFWIMHPNTI